MFPPLDLITEDVKYSHPGSFSRSAPTSSRHWLSKCSVNCSTCDGLRAVIVLFFRPGFRFPASLGGFQTLKVRNDSLNNAELV